MSHNLECDEIKLWQMPTWVTDMCLSWRNGASDGGWQGVCYRYRVWVISHTNGVWRNPGQLQEMRDRIAEHLADIDRAVKRHGSLTFSRN